MSITHCTYTITELLFICVIQQTKFEPVQHILLILITRVTVCLFIHFPEDCCLVHCRNILHVHTSFCYIFKHPVKDCARFRCIMLDCLNSTRKIISLRMRGKVVDSFSELCYVINKLRNRDLYSLLSECSQLPCGVFWITSAYTGNGELYDQNEGGTFKRAYELKDIVKAPLQDNRLTSLKGLNTHSTLNGVKFNISDLFQLVKNNDSSFNPKTSSKTVDENGEPLAVKKDGQLGITPAYAGEKGTQLWIEAGREGSPLRMRGKVFVEELKISLRRITPAYAGKRQGILEDLLDEEDHPCVCGEKMGEAGTEAIMPGSPLRMRGKE